MARRQQLLGQLEEPRGKKQPKPPPNQNQSPRYPPEVKAKAYTAFLDGSGWSDCARAIGHPEPNGSGAIIVKKWAEDDHWTRPMSSGDYKAKVEKERNADPQRISDEVDDLCVQMQRVSEKYISQYIDEETGEILINSSFKTRDFADMAAALRMIHETRIKIRKSNEPKDAGKDGKQNDFLSLIREAGQNRLRENRRRAGIVAQKPPEEEEPANELQQEQHGNAQRVSGDSIRFPNLSDLRAKIESELNNPSGNSEAESLEADSGSDRE